MNKLDKADELLQAKIENMIRLAEKQFTPKFSSFLDEHQRSLADEVLKRERCTTYLYFGGFSESDRVMLGVWPEYMEIEEDAFPLQILEFRFHKNYTLTHRDFLGSLMAQQIKREMVGDIVLAGGIANVAVCEEVVAFLQNNISKIGRVGVSLRIVEKPSVERVQEFSELSGTIASLRLDSVVALLTKLSRTKAVELIEAGKVTVNHAEIDSSSFMVKAKDTVTVRGFGKYILSDEIRLTKKNRLFVTAYKYI